MIDNQTTLILGAGASMPFGFPSGEQLLNSICGSLRDLRNAVWMKIFRDFGHQDSDVLKFQKDLGNSGYYSVDAFLEIRQEYLDIGKLAITLALIPYENPNNLAIKDNNWYRYLFNKLGDTDFDNFSRNKLSIITFNYDRSLEFYLLHTIKYAYGKNISECYEKLKSIPIIHVHGKLCNLQCEGEPSRAYETDIGSMVNIENAMNGIIVISESINDSKEFQQAFKLIENSSRTYILGFGYHKRNMRRLGLQNIRNKHFSGTSLYMGESDKRNIKSNWPITLFDNHNDVLEFLSNHANWS